MGTDGPTTGEKMRVVSCLLALCLMLELVSAKIYLVETKGKGSNVKHNTRNTGGMRVRSAKVDEPAVVPEEQQYNEYEYGKDYSEYGEDYNAAGWVTPTPPTTTTWAQCVLSEWGQWSNKNICGKNVERTRERKCERVVGNNREACNECNGANLSETGRIDLEDCCGWGVWGPWSQPSTTCAPATVQRQRKCELKKHGAHGVVCQPTDCPGSPTETKNLQGQPCCNWSLWSDGHCSATCGPATKPRTRQCNCEGVTGNCPGSSSDQQACTLPACPVIWTTIPSTTTTTTAAAGWGATSGNGPAWGKK